LPAIEAQGHGSLPMPWHHDGIMRPSRPVNAGTGKAYRGSNILSLWIAAQAAGYSSGRWASYRQWQALGAQVRKGEQATTIVFWKVNDRGEDADDRDSEQEGVAALACLRGGTAFSTRRRSRVMLHQPSISCPTMRGCGTPILLGQPWH
jgi:antirestriction protein ArdC